MPCVIAHRLEGSRFGACPADLANFVSSLVRLSRVKTGGSRKRLDGMHTNVAVEAFTPGS
jgi:hypothetical protein